MATLTLILQFLPYILQIIQLVESLFTHSTIPAPAGTAKKQMATGIINTALTVSGQAPDATTLADIIDVVVGVLNATGTFKHSTK